jgi:hypothetical protein
MASAKKAAKPAAPKRALSAAKRTMPLLGKEMMVEQRDRNVPAIPEGPKVRRCFERDPDIEEMWGVRVGKDDWKMLNAKERWTGTEEEALRAAYQMRAEGTSCEAKKLPPGVIHDAHLTQEGDKTLCGLLAHREAKETYPGKVCQACRVEASKVFAEVVRG